MKNLFCILTFFLIFSACIKPVDIDLPVHQSKLVVNSFLLAGDTIKVHVSKSVGQKDYLPAYLSNALVIVTADHLTDTLKFGKYGWYWSAWKAEPTANYLFEVSTPDYEKVWTRVTVPEPVSFSLENFIPRTSASEQGFFISSIDVVINDDLKCTKYYQLFQKNHESVRRVDNGIYGNGIRSHTPEIIEQMEDETLGDLIFTNEPFQGNDELRLNIEYAYSNNIDSISIHIYALSEECYRYKISQRKHSWGKIMDNIWGGYDIYPLYSGVENGYGIVASYAESKLSFYTYSPIEP